MGKDIIIRGVTRQGIETFSAPISGGGTAVFRDTSGADAVAGDLAAGKLAYGAAGQIIGTKQPPSGSISITENGSVDVTDYATALVNVQSGGGGPTAADAILLVTAPASSVVTMTKGADTRVPTMWVSASDPSRETALFVVEQADFDASTAWTVTATLGTNTASDTVIIDSNKEYDVELSFELWLVRNGVSLVQPILCYMDVVADPDFYILSSQAGVRGDGASWLIDSAANYTTITFVFSKDKSTILSGMDDRCGLGTGLVYGGSIAAQNATYLAYSAILPLTNGLETRVVPVGNLQTQGNYAQVSVRTGSAAGSRVIAIKDIYLSR